jgi:hypothetical protein
MSAARQGRSDASPPPRIEMTPELVELAAQAKGERPFVPRDDLEVLAALSEYKFWKLPAERRLALGFYLTAKKAKAA